MDTADALMLRLLNILHSSGMWTDETAICRRLRISRVDALNGAIRPAVAAQWLAMRRTYGAEDSYKLTAAGRLERVRLGGGTEQAVHKQTVKQHNERRILARAAKRCESENKRVARSREQRAQRKEEAPSAPGQPLDDAIARYADVLGALAHGPLSGVDVSRRAKTTSTRAYTWLARGAELGLCRRVNHWTWALTAKGATWVATFAPKALEDVPEIEDDEPDEDLAVGSPRPMGSQPNVTRPEAERNLAAFLAEREVEVEQQNRRALGLTAKPMEDAIREARREWIAAGGLAAWIAAQERDELAGHIHFVSGATRAEEHQGAA